MTSPDAETITETISVPEDVLTGIVEYLQAIAPLLAVYGDIEQAHIAHANASAILALIINSHKDRATRAL